MEHEATLQMKPPLPLTDPMQHVVQFMKFAFLEGHVYSMPRASWGRAVVNSDEDRIGFCVRA
eukprot:3245506-Pyramimonas_sp.AAC.1